MAFSRPHPVAGALTLSFTSNASQNWKNIAPGPTYGCKLCQSNRLICTGLSCYRYQRCLDEVDMGLTSSSKIFDMPETAKSKRFLQILENSRVVLSVVLVKVFHNSLDVSRTVLRHVFAYRREVAPVVTY